MAGQDDQQVMPPSVHRMIFPLDRLLAPVEL
jgi:hypothetical protein